MADHRNIRAAGPRPNLTGGVRIKEHADYEEHRKGSQRASQNASKAVGALLRMEGKGALGVATQARHAAALATAAAEGHTKAARLTNSPQTRASHEHLARAHTLSAKHLTTKANAAQAPGASRSAAGQTFSYMRRHAEDLSRNMTPGASDHREARDAHRAAAAAAGRPGAHVDPAAGRAAVAEHTKAAAAHARGAVAASRDAGAGAALWRLMRVAAQPVRAGGITGRAPHEARVGVTRVPSTPKGRAEFLANRAGRVGGWGKNPSAEARVVSAAGALAPRAHLFTGGTKKVAAGLRADAARIGRTQPGVTPGRNAHPHAGHQATRGAQMPPALKGVSGWAIWRAKNKWRVK